MTNERNELSLKVYATKSNVIILKTIMVEHECNIHRIHKDLKSE
jgi:hypothetical protein